MLNELELDALAAATAVVWSWWHVRRKIPPKGDAEIAIRQNNQGRMPPPGETSPSVARALSDLEAECLAAIALALPASWVVQVEPPYGQVAITPVQERNRFHRSWVASGSQRRIFREDALREL